mmetsp:Transcript_15584/g.33804  ORF Transcript_15584/g.33804 Transcript_15584/m.33804 type:complete len:277 (+) Transcript_15584:130-960(+)
MALSLDAVQPRDGKNVTCDDDVINLSDVFDQKIHLLSSTLEAVERKCQVLTSRLVTTESEADVWIQRCAEAEAALAKQRTQQEKFQQSEKQLKEDVQDLQHMLEAQRAQSTLTEYKLQQLLGEERMRYERMRSLRDDALLQRDEAVSQLACVYADMDAMQATLSDSAVYVRYLRKRVLELEMEHTRNAARSMLGGDRSHGSEGSQAGGVFSLHSIKTAIQEAVQDACKCDEDEKRRRLKQLQLRWHPDKNPVLAELATEVTKLIHEAVAQHTGGKP